MKGETPHEPRPQRPRRARRSGSRLPACVLALALGAGCGGAVDRALESDARGYLCGGCAHRFYTPAETIADVCPRCRSGELAEVLGYVCSAEGHMTLGPRAKGGIPCAQCGRRASGIRLPTAADLAGWGAERRGANEVRNQ